LKLSTKQEELLKTLCRYKCRDLHFEAHESVTSGSRLPQHAPMTLAVIINFLAFIAGKRKLQRIKLAQSICHQNRGNTFSEAFGNTRIKLGFLCPVAY